MSYFSNHSSSQHAHTTTEPAPPASTTTILPRQRTSSSSLRSKLSLSISNSSDVASSLLTNTNGAASALKASSTIPYPTPLRSTWVFWFRQQRNPGNKITNYEEGIKKVAAFSSVESFWSLHVHLNPPSSLTPTTDYLLFHSLVRRPVWEDPLNMNGGKWIIRLRKGISDRLWEDLVLAIIGDQFDVEDGICGCVLSVRGNEDILSVWNGDNKDAEAKNRIREGIRKTLNLPPATQMEYKSNNDSLHDKSSFRTIPTISTNTVANLVPFAQN